MALGETAQLAVQLNLTGNFNREGTKAIGTIKGMATQTKSLQSQVKSSILQGVGLGAGVTGFNLLAQGIHGAIDAVGGAIDAASDLAESQSKVNVVFAEGAREVQDWGKSAATAMGLSEQAALEAAGTFGNFIQALGNSREEAQDMSLAMVELAADLASFNNTDINEVIIALRSGLAGEAEPMRRLGVSISATRVEANILAKGIARTKEEITDAMKVSERYAIIMEDTALAQGDFARTSDGLANKQRILDARLANVNATIGRGLIPAMDAAIGLMGGFADVITGLTSAGGEDGSLDALMADLRRTAGVFEETGKAAEETGDQWALTGTAADSLLDALHNVRDAAADMGALPGLVKEDEWRTALASVQESLGLTDDQIKIIITEATAMNLTLEQTRDSLTRTAAVAGNQKMWAAMGAGMRQAAGGAEALGEGVGDAAVEVGQAARFIEKTLADLPEKMSDTIRGGRREVRKAMQDLRFAMEHPFAGERYVNFLRNRQRQAQRNLNEAMDQGNIDAAMRAQAIVDSITGTLAQLDDQRYNFRVSYGFRAIGGLGGAPRNVGENWSGGIIPPGSWGTVGERGTERIRNVGGVAVVEPMSQSSGNRTEIIVQTRPVITAFMVGRELGRAATTRRSGAGVL